MKLQHVFVQCLILFISAFLLSCTEEDVAPDDTTNDDMAYRVSGTVVDTQGNPIAGAKVRADNDALYGSAEVITDANGKYTLPKLEIGGWKIYAWKEVDYKGKTYHLRLGMPQEADYNAFSPGEEGLVRNFQWQLSGIIPDRPRSEQSGSGYFGGTLLFTNLSPDVVSMSAGTEVTVTLTPVPGATLFDGSAPEVVQKSFTIEDGEFNYWIHDIPQCEYRITAHARINGSSKDLHLTMNLDEAHSTAIENFYFKPDGLSSGSYENGLGSTNDHPIFIFE